MTDAGVTYPEILNCSLQLRPLLEKITVMFCTVIRLMSVVCSSKNTLTHVTLIVEEPRYQYVRQGLYIVGSEVKCQTLRIVFCISL